jgi:hypothetical protein
MPERARRIRDLVGVARTCIIEIGRELIAAKAEVGHGDWSPWLKVEFGWSDSTAQNYMNVARKFPTLGNFTAITIDATALYALSAPDVPQEARDEAVERAEAGERITTRQAYLTSRATCIGCELTARKRCSALRPATKRAATNG